MLGACRNVSDAKNFAVKKSRRQFKPVGTKGVHYGDFFGFIIKTNKTEYNVFNK